MKCHCYRVPCTLHRCCYRDGRGVQCKFKRVQDDIPACEEHQARWHEVMAA